MTTVAEIANAADNRHYDAIVIGSGMGALTFACLMAKLRGWRVLVLERHFKIGGFTHTFRRPGGFEWDVGLHYVGDMGERMMGRRMLDYMIDGAVRWNPLPDTYDRFVYPDFQFDVRKGETKFRKDLIRAFPRERAGIRRYFRDLKSAMAWFARRARPMAIPASRIATASLGLASKPQCETCFSRERTRALGIMGVMGGVATAGRVLGRFGYLTVMGAMYTRRAATKS